MTKLEKLKEVKTMLDTALIELEARLFIENGNDIREKVIQEEKPKVLVEIKQQV